MAKHTPTEDQINAMIAEFQGRHRLDDAKSAPHLTTDEMASLMTLLLLHIPGAKSLFEMLMIVDRDRVTKDIIQATYGLGYLRALEDLRQERVVG